jgi:chromosome partitioning protein
MAIASRSSGHSAQRPVVETGHIDLPMCGRRELAHRIISTIDADPTGALFRWAERAYEGPPFESAAEADETRLAHLIAAKADAADLVLVDTAGFGNRAATVAMTSADAVLVPSLVGEADITETERTSGLVAALARAARREIPVRVLMNRVKRTTLARHAANEMNTAGLTRLDSSFSDLVAFGELTYSGSLVEKSAAAAEVAALVAELRKLGWIPTKTPPRNAVRAKRRMDVA